MKDLSFKYYFWVVFSIVIPIITYILYPGTDAIPNIIKTTLILSMYHKMRYRGLIANNIHIGKLYLFIFVIIFGIIHSLLTCPMNYTNIALLVMDNISWLTALILFMVKDIASIGRFVKAFVWVLIPTAIVSGFYWYGFFQFDVPHILTMLALCLLISPYFSVKIQFVIICSLLAGTIYDYSVRSCLLTALVSFSLYLLYRLCPANIFKKVAIASRRCFFIAPFIFAILGVTQTFNIFADFESMDMSNISLSNGRKSESHTFNVDSRTVVYVDVLNSIQDPYDLLVGQGSVINLESAWTETRHSVEAGILNIFLRYGLIGCFVFFYLAWHFSRVGIKKTNNMLTVLAGLFIAYKFLLSFMDDANIDPTVYIAMGICINPYIRNLTDKDIESQLKKVSLV